MGFRFRVEGSLPEKFRVWGVGRVEVLFWLYLSFVNGFA